MNRAERVLRNSMQSKIPFKRGTPSSRELKEHSPEIRITPHGLAMYAKHDGVLYKTNFDRGESKNLQLPTVEKTKINSKELELKGGRIITPLSTDLVLDPHSAKVRIKDNNVDRFLFDSASTALTIFDDQDTGDLFKITVAQHGATTIETVDDDATAGNLTLKPDGDLYFEPEGQQIYYNNSSGNLAANWSISSVTAIALYEAGGSSTDDYLSISVANNGMTTIATVDAAAAAANLLMNIDGYMTATTASAMKTVGGSTNTLQADGGDITLDASTGIYKFLLDSDADDLFQITVAANGATRLATADSDGAVGHLSIVPDGHVEFDNCAVGFDLLTPTYNASDTDVSFINGNKQFVTFGAGNITDLNLIFPATSGNFVLLVKQDGTGITNYKAWDLVNSDAASGSATVKFAGGSNPTLTTDANHVDILSFFWDADNQIAYGVASLDFQF